MKKIKLSVDDGCASDVRVAALAEKYDVETIFYWPVEWHSLAHENGYKPLSFKEACLIADKFEIGAHTITHRHLTKITYAEAMYEIDESQRMLEELFGIAVYKFCPPRGYTNEELTEFTFELYDSQRLTKGKGLVHIHPDSGANGNVSWLTKAEELGDQLEELWCHSWELDKYNLWDELEDFFK